MNIEIREVGEKLRELRKKLNLKQDDLVKYSSKSIDSEKTFTRNLVSMVETGKAPLTKKMADTIHKNILLACKEKDISPEFDFKEICKTPEEQIIEYIDNYSKNIAKYISIDESIKYAETLIKLASEYKLLDNLAELYFLVGDITFSYDYTISLKYYTAAYTLVQYLSPKRQILLIKNLKKTYIFLDQHENALNLGYDTVHHSEYAYKQCLFNDILSLKKLNKLDEAFSRIETLKKILNKNDEALSIKLRMLESNLYHLSGNYQKFIELNESLLKLTKDSVQYLIILKNIVEAKTKLGISSLEEVDKLASLEIPESLTQVAKAEILSDISSAYEPFNKEKSFKYLTLILEDVVSNISLTPKSQQYFNDTIELIFNDSKKVDILIESYYDSFKLMMHTAVEKELLEQKTLLKMIHHFLNKKEYEFLNKLIERKIS